MHLATAFGLTWQSEFQLEHFSAASDEAQPPDVIVRHVRKLVDRPEGRTINRGTVYADGFRFTWSDIVTFDSFDGVRIEVLPLTGWTGALPWPFYSTVTALLLAWRGKLPLHASAIRIAGKAVLLCGPSGAGKSTLCAALVANGAELLSDDLTIIAPGSFGQPPHILPGRPGVRLFSAIAAQLPGAVISPLNDDHRHKVMAEWPSNSANGPSAIAAVILLQDQSAPINPAARIALLRRQLFRPQWLDLLPHAQSRFSALAAVVQSAKMLVAAPLEPFDARNVAARIVVLSTDISRL